MSQSNLEFLGRIQWLTRLKDLETRVARLERFGDGGDDPIAQGEATEGEATTLQGPPSIRNTNTKFVNGLTATVEARPNALLALDPLGNVDYRRAGGTVFANRVVAGYGDNTAIMDGVDSSYRFWAGASAAGSAPFRGTP